MLKLKKIYNTACELKAKAEKFRNENSYKMAVKEYLGAILLDKYDFESYYGLGVSYKFLNRIDKAIDSFEKAIMLNTNNAKAFYELGICYLISGQICQAMHNLRNSITIDKTNLDAQIQLAMAHEAVDEQDMALLIYKHIMELHPHYIKAYEHASFLLMNLERYQEAGQILSKLIKIFPECIHAYLGMGICFEKLNNIKSAKRCFKRFLTLTDNKEQIEMVQKKLQKFDPVEKPQGHLSLVK